MTQRLSLRQEMKSTPRQTSHRLTAHCLTAHCLATHCLATHCSATRFVLTAVLMVFFMGAGASSSADGDLVVATNGGRIRGALRASGGAEFLGIPYAQPPVGELRWHEPVAFESWTGTRDATSFGAPCAQPLLGDWNKHDSESGREDCLFLNIMTPVWPPKRPLPVMFWLHGGANVGGTASSALYKDGTLIQHGVLLVTVNYRLGVFGFFAHPGLTGESSHRAAGNYGLMDQGAALRWVRDNIAAFGGDPGNITIFGQSAGAQDAGLLMISPLSKDLFQRAIAQSGSPISSPLPSLSVAEEYGAKLAAALKAPMGRGAIKYLRQLSAQELLQNMPPQDPSQPPLIGPIVDGWVISRSPAEAFASGRESSIPLVIGTTTREFGMSASPDELTAMIQKATGSLASRALPLYGLAKGGQGITDPVYGPAASQWLADVAFRCPVTTQAWWHSGAHHATYEYEFEHAIPGQEADGAVHSSDLPYVFGFYPRTGNISGKFGVIDYKLADLMETYWTNFAKTGDPNSGTLPQWPKFDGSQSLLEFAEDGQAVVKTGGLRRPQCDLYREVLKQHTNH